jgi:uracil phosphoribosyltransferase
LPDLRAARRDPVPESAGFLEFAQKGGASAKAFELVWRLAGVLRHRRTPWGANRAGSGAVQVWQRAKFPAANRRPVPFRLMQILVVDHPLVAHKLTALRDERTDSPTFRRLTEELVTLLAYEATRDVRTGPVTVQTPVAEAEGVKLTAPKPLVVPILRAGLGMLEGMSRLLPTAEVGFLGMVRNEETLTASTYAERLPEDLSGRQCYVLDPMLATGGTLAVAIQFLVERGADHITAICLLAAPEGVERVERELAELAVPCNLVIAGMDSHLNEKGYIVPGLGDAGDRLYGVAQ